MRFMRKHIKSIFFNRYYKVIDKDNAINAIDLLPSVQPERKESDWIPISERLPEEEGRYLVTDDAGGVKTVQDDEFLYREDGTPLWLYSQNVTAWSHLPSPYRGEKDDEMES